MDLLSTGQKTHNIFHVHVDVSVTLFLFLTLYKGLGHRHPTVFPVLYSQFYC